MITSPSRVPPCQSGIAEPLAAGMAAALPHVDAFVSGHSLAALERLAALVAGARGRELADA